MVSGSDSPGRPDGLPALQPAEAGLEILRLVEIDPGRLGPSDLEQQRLDLREPAVAREGRVIDAAPAAGRMSVALPTRRFVRHAGGRIGDTMRLVGVDGGGAALAVQHRWVLLRL
jgi:hypothetical protein